jgi:clan AA aspartic protease (TIGR02281 family)
MPRRYTVEVEIHRTVSVTPKKSVSWGGLVLLFLFLFGIGVAALALTAENAKHKSTAQDFHNPLAPKDDNHNDHGPAPDDDPIPDVPPFENGARRLVIPGNSYHQCYVEGQATAVKTAPFRYLIDTGAWTVAFSRRGAEAMGLDTGKLVFDQTISTANGTGKAATIRLRELRVGEFVFKDVTAQVNDKGLDNPLLGATVLKKFLRLEYAQGNCVLTLASDESAGAQAAQHAMRERRDMNRLIEIIR